MHSSIINKLYKSQCLLACLTILSVPCFFSIFKSSSYSLMHKWIYKYIYFYCQKLSFQSPWKVSLFSQNFRELSFNPQKIQLMYIFVTNVVTSMAVRLPHADAILHPAMSHHNIYITNVTIIYKKNINND